MSDYNISNGTLSFNDDVKEISSNQFKNNKLIKHIVIGANITNIDAEAFSMCSNVESVKVDEANKKYYCPKEANCIVDKDNGMLVFGCKNSVIDSCVTGIGPFAFSGQEQLIEINIPCNVKSIGSYAFDGCVNLKKVVIEDGVERIGANCFRLCDSLDEIVLPKTLKEVDNTLFGFCYEEYYQEVEKYDCEDFIGTIDEQRINELCGCRNLKKIRYTGTLTEFRSSFDIGSIMSRNHINDILEEVICCDGNIKFKFDDDQLF